MLRPRAGLLSGAGAGADDDDAAACFGPPDLDRAFGSSGYSVYSGRVEVLRARVGLALGAGATMTSSFGAFASAARFAAAATVAARFDASVGLGTAAVMDTAALGVEAARGFLALASAAAAATSRFVCLGTDAAPGTEAALGTEAARGFLVLSSAAVAAASRFAAVGTDAARFGARGTDTGAGASFVAEFSAFGVFNADIAFFSSSIFALAFARGAFNMCFSALTLPLPVAGGCPPCGGGVMPAGVPPGPLTSCSIKSLGLVFLDIRKRCTFSAMPLMCVSFVVFPTIIAFPFAAVPEPDEPDGGGCPPSCETSIG